MLRILERGPTLDQENGIVRRMRDRSAIGKVDRYFVSAKNFDLRNAAFMETDTVALFAKEVEAVHYHCTLS